MSKLGNYLLFLGLLGVFLMPQKTLAQNYNMEKIFYLPAFNAVAGVASVEKNCNCEFFCHRKIRTKIESPYC